MLSVKTEANTILSRFVSEEMDKTVCSNLRSDENVVEIKTESAQIL